MARNGNTVTFTHAIETREMLRVPNFLLRDGYQDDVKFIHWR